MGWAVLQIRLSDILRKKMDLRKAQDLSPYFRNEMLAKAKKAYSEN